MSARSRPLTLYPYNSGCRIRSSRLRVSRRLGGRGLVEGGMAYRRYLKLLLLLLMLAVLPLSAGAQPAPARPPAVGVVRAERQQITQTDEFMGRIQSVGRVALVARVSACVEKRLFVEGAEVKPG